jgi:hypothetical protein
VTGEEKLKEALARDRGERLAGEERERTKQEETKRRREREREAHARFKELKIAMRAAMERLQPLLAQNQLVVSLPGVSVSEGLIDTFTFSVLRDRQVVANIAIVLWGNGAAGIEGTGGRCSSTIPRSTRIISTTSSPRSSPTR